MRASDGRIGAGGVTLLALLSGCIGPEVCTTSEEFGLEVLVIDDVSGVAVGGPGTSVLAREGSYSETLQEIGAPGRFLGARERAGTYEVTVTATGFRAFSADGVEVTRGECHVERTVFTARLSPQ